MTEPGGTRALRLSDFDREQAVSDLKAHAAAGRLSVDELSDRVAAAYGAETFGDLADLMGDLPDLTDTTAVVRPAAAGRRRRPFWPGVAPFTELVEVSLAPAEVRQRILQNLAPPLATYGYELVDADPDRLGFEQRDRPIWGKRRVIRIRLEEQGEGRTRMLVHGSAPLGVRRAFAGLREL